MLRDLFDSHQSTDSHVNSSINPRDLRSRLDNPGLPWSVIFLTYYYDSEIFALII